MSTDHPIPERERQPNGASVHDTETDATGQRIWSAYGSSPGLIDLDHASAPTEFSTLTRATGSLSADIFARWGSHAAAPSSRVPLPFAGLRLQRTVRAGVRGTPSAASRRPAAGIVARSVDSSSPATSASSAVLLLGPAPAETGSSAESVRPTRTIPADAAKHSAQPALSSVARRDPLLLRATSQPPHAVPVSRASDLAGGDEVHDAPGTPHAVDSMPLNRREPVTNVSDPLRLSPGGASSSEIVQASSESGQVSAVPKVVAAAARSMPAESPIHVQASTRQADVTQQQHEDHIAPTTEPAPQASVTESVPRMVAMSPRTSFQPLIWRKAATTWSGSRSQSPFIGPAMWTLHPTINVRWPLVSRTALDRMPLDRMPLNRLWPSWTVAESAPRSTSAGTEPDAPSRPAVGSVPQQLFQGNSGVVIARAVSIPTQTMPAVLTMPSGASVPRVFRVAAVAPAHDAASVAASASATPVAPADGPPSAIEASSPTGPTTWIQQAAPTSSSLQREPRVGAAIGITIHQPVSVPAGAVSSPLSHPLVSRARSSSVVGLPTTSSTPASTTGATSVAASLSAGNASTRRGPVTVAGHASSSVPFGSATWMTARTIDRAAHSLSRSPLTLLARAAVSDGPLNSMHDSASVPTTVMVDDKVSGADGARPPVIQRGDVASHAGVPGVPHLEAMGTAASHGVGASTTFTPLLRSNLLLRTASPMMFRSSRHDAGAFGASEMPEPTGHGAHELALTIIGRNSPATVDTADHRSVLSHGLIQRSHAVDYFAPTMNAPGVPASALAASSQSPLHEVAIERPLSRGAQGRGAHGDIYVFRKQARGGPALRDQSIETLAPPIGQVSELPMIQTEALNVPASEPRSEPAPAADVNAGSSTQSVGGMDIDELVERVSRRLSRQLAIEHERRGAPTWR